MSPTRSAVLGYMLIDHVCQVGLSIDIVPTEGRWKVVGGYIRVWKGRVVRSGNGRQLGCLERVRW